MREEPTVRVVRGSPTAEELAALVSVLAAAARRTPPPAGRAARDRWTARPTPPDGRAARDRWTARLPGG